jgi:hypothetical protein
LMKWLAEENQKTSRLACPGTTPPTPTEVWTALRQFELRHNRVVFETIFQVALRSGAIEFRIPASINTLQYTVFVSRRYENLFIRRHDEGMRGRGGVLFLLLHGFVCERHLAYQHCNPYNLTSLFRRQAFNLLNGETPSSLQPNPWPDQVGGVTSHSGP